MTNYLFTNLFVSGSWRQQYEVETDQEGIITYSGQPRGGSAIPVYGPAIPGNINAHSHAFQYAMSGLTETFTRKKDDFWSWRKAMYDLALTISPDILESIAAMLYSEMLVNGYTHVVEFHYLHHQPNGDQYDSISAMGQSLLRAADQVGIGITLVPIYYNMGGFGKSPLEEQRRFISSDIDDYHSIIESTQKALKAFPKFKLGYGGHSLRAVGEQDLQILLRDFKDFGPFHMHISEQQQEIQSCVEFYGARPVQWLSDMGGLSENIHLVHATHINPTEVQLLAESGANIILCPSTEGNLGDGIFPLVDFSGSNGNFCIGSDSHIGLNPMEELRWLNYQHRLGTHLRNALQRDGSTGAYLWGKCFINGCKAADIDLDPVVGNLLNVVILDPHHPLIEETHTDYWFNTLIFSGDRSFISSIISNGKKTVENGHHLKTEELRKNWKKALKMLALRL